MTTVIFGKDFNLVGNDKYRYVPNAIEKSNLRMSVLLSDKKWKTGGIDKWIFPESIRGREMFLKFVGQLIRRRTQEGSDTNKDVFSIVCGAVDPETGERLSPKQIAAESVTLIVAGMSRERASPFQKLVGPARADRNRRGHFIDGIFNLLVLHEPQPPGICHSGSRSTPGIRICYHGVFRLRAEHLHVSTCMYHRKHEDHPTNWGSHVA